MKKIALLGSTGSIGRQVLNCVRRHPNNFKITALVAGSNAKLLAEQAVEFAPNTCGLTDASKANQLASIPQTTTLYLGENAMLHAIDTDCDVVFVAVVGFCGLRAVIEAIKRDKIIALANKEALVAGGQIVKDLLARHPKAKILPVDSEHSAVWQSLGLDEKRPFKNIILTASGGAFRDFSLDALKTVTAKDALKHPNWLMGKKITIDCATMLNKGLEVMEAMWLFDCSPDKIKVVVHPESIIHSMVEFEDSAVVCQMAYPSMEIPIQLALTYPNRLKTDVESYNFFEKPLTFKPVDNEKYPCFNLALESAKQGYNYPCALSSANEVAVDLFLQGKIAYLDIYGYLEHALSVTKQAEVSFESLLQTDEMARLAVLQKFREVNK